MATIEVYSSKTNYMCGLINGIIDSVTTYDDNLGVLSNLVLVIDESICNLADVVSSIRSSTVMHEEIIGGLDTFEENTGEFISSVFQIDEDVADLIEESKDDFYKLYSYLKPECECEKSDWENLCDSVAEWWDENLEYVVALVIAVIVIVAIVAICIATFGVGVTLILAGIGILLGLGSQLLSDVISGMITGEFKFSSWQSYLSSAIGGAAGVMMFALAGPFASAITDSALSTWIGGSLESCTGGEQRSMGFIFVTTIFSAALSGALLLGLEGLSKSLSKSLANTWSKVITKFPVFDVGITPVIKPISDVVDNIADRFISNESANFWTKFIANGIVDEESVGSGLIDGWDGWIEDRTGVSVVDVANDGLDNLMIWLDEENQEVPPEFYLPGTYPYAYPYAYSN